jgi:UDP-N-acetylglucosamine/UDP-N-acetylgalactosamine diphosphorylase
MVDKPMTHFLENLYTTPCDDHPSKVFHSRKIGLVIMAGGLATRLGLNVPKGMIPFSPIMKKSVFQIFAEKVLAFEACYHTSVPLAIMTSVATDAETKAFFQKNHFFGLSPENVSFFVQDSLPFLTEEGKPFLDKNGHPVLGPDGNGKVFTSFYKALFSDWKKKGVEAISLIPIDNPLLDPFHPQFFQAVFSGHDIACACMKRNHEKEEVGVFIEKEGKVSIVEYSELQEELKKRHDKIWANLSEYAVSFDFVEKAAFHAIPLHNASKMYEGQSIIKQEYFVFDHLPFASKAAVIPLSRELYFAPIKRKDGEHSIKSAESAYMEKDKKRFSELSKKACLQDIELCQQAYYPTKEYLRWIQEGRFQEGYDSF